MSEPDAGGLAALRGGRIFVAGHRGMVGSALLRRLAAVGCDNLLTRSRAQLDLLDQSQVTSFMLAERPDFVIIAAARVGGIHANNSQPAQFIHENLAIAVNLVHAAWQAGVQRLLFLGSSCIYPRLAPQPMPESSLLEGRLEPTNEPYAVAKIAGIKLCESYNRQYGTDFRSVMPTNLYGPQDNFDLASSHVLAALLRKFHAAKSAGADSVEVWGSGRPRREFLHVDDLADACLHVMCLPQAQLAEHTSPMCSHLNIGTGTDVSIAELAELIGELTGYRGRIEFNPAYPDGTPRKLLDVSKLAALGWRASIPLRQGLERTYRWYLEQQSA